MCQRPYLIITFIFTFLFLHIHGKLYPYTECGGITPVVDEWRTFVPWNAVIYFRRNDSSPFDFHTSGVILGPRTILSVAGGQFGKDYVWQKKQREYSLQSPQNTRIAFGLSSNNLDYADSNAQISEVSRIIPFRNHDEVNKEFHFLIYELKYPLNFRTPYVKPLCLNTSYLRPYNAPLLQFGFPSGKNAQLEIFTTRSRGEAECEKEFLSSYGHSAHHLFCVQLRDKESCLLHGSTAAFEDGQGRWSLAGQVVLIPTMQSGVCGGVTINFYSKLTPEVYSWLEHHLACAEINQFPCGDQTCLPPSKLCNSITDCANNSDEDEIFCRSVLNCRDNDLVTCKKAQKKHETSQRIPLTAAQPSTMSNGKGLVNRTCPELEISGGVKAECETESGVKTNCTSAQVNTRAKLSCEKFYTTRYRFPSVEMKCEEGPEWVPFRSFACDPDCGVLSSEYQPLLKGGRPTTRNDAFPWHAAIFRKIKDEYVYICGASLIEKSLLLSAGHCVSIPVEYPSLISQYRVVLAPISSHFLANLEDNITQILEVKRAWIPPTYNQRTLRSDIAVIELTKPVSFGGFVRPVCYLWRFTSPRLQQIPPVGSVGKIAGLGIDETGEISSSLKYIKLPVIDSEICKREFSRTSPQSMFCGGAKNRTAAVCQGDSGGGFVFPEKRGNIYRYILKGIVSSGHITGSRRCDAQKHAAFTHVDHFGDWIVDILEGMELH